MPEINFITWDELLQLHRAQLESYGGQDGFIDEGVARSVLNRPQFTRQYDPEADFADLAADYMFGFATTQGFSDGNKRTAAVAAVFFLHKNGYDLSMVDTLLYVITMAIARSELDREELADLLRDYIIPLDPDAE